MCPQALDWERLGPERKPYSESRRRRLAVQEAATALVATLQVSRWRKQPSTCFCQWGVDAMCAARRVSNAPCASSRVSLLRHALRSRA